MADSFGDDGLSEDEGPQHSAQFISEPTGKPDESWKQVAGSRLEIRSDVPAITVCWRKTEPRAARKHRLDSVARALYRSAGACLFGF